MFAKSVVATTLLALVAATVATEPASQCNTGPVQCCESTSSTMTSSDIALLTELGIVLSGVDLPIGFNCSPLTVVGVGSGATCSEEPVCCENNSYNGLVALGCDPVNLNL